MPFPSLSLQLPAPNMFDSYGGMMGAGGPSNVGQGSVLSGSPNPPMFPQMSASCPNAMQDEHGRLHGRPSVSLFLTPAVNHSPLPGPPLDTKLVEKERQKKNNHNMSEPPWIHVNKTPSLPPSLSPSLPLSLLASLFPVERRRRFNINDRIKELGMLLPSTET